MAGLINLLNAPLAYSQINNSGGTEVKAIFTLQG